MAGDRLVICFGRRFLRENDRLAEQHQDTGDSEERAGEGIHDEETEYRRIIPTASHSERSAGGDVGGAESKNPVANRRLD